MSAVLEKYMQVNKITQSQLSRMMGCVPSTIYGWLLNRRVPRLNSARRLAKVSKGAVPVSTWGWVETPPGSGFFEYKGPK